MGPDRLPARRAFDPTELVPSFAPVSPDDIVGHFLAGRNPRTLRAYDGDLKDFARFVGLDDPRRAVASLLAAGPASANAAVLRYRVAMEEKGLSPATVGRRLAAVRSVVKLARTLGQIVWTIEIQSPKVETYRDTRGPGRDGVRSIVGGLKSGGSAVRVRDLAIVRLLYDLALRRGELVALDLEDVEIEGTPPRPVSLWARGKGRGSKERFTLPDGTILALMGWLEIRGPEPGPLFLRLDPAVKYTGESGRLTDRSVGRLVGRAGVRAGLDRKVRAHGLRHAAITSALDQTSDVTKVQRFSRHKDLRTLGIYDDRRQDFAGQIARGISDDLD